MRVARLSWLESWKHFEGDSGIWNSAMFVCRHDFRPAFPPNYNDDINGPQQLSGQSSELLNTLMIIRCTLTIFDFAYLPFPCIHILVNISLRKLA